VKYLVLTSLWLGFNKRLTIACMSSQ